MAMDVGLDGMASEGCKQILELTGELMPEPQCPAKKKLPCTRVRGPKSVLKKYSVERSWLAAFSPSGARKQGVPQ
jgi:hypothetical protein